MTDTIHVEQLKVKNLLAIKECEFALGKLTTVSGANTRGKSSIVEALKSLSGGNDPTLIRDGADEAEVYVKLSDGTEIVKKIREQNPRLTVLSPTAAGEPAAIRKPQTFLDALLGGSWFNPVTFMLARPKDRGRLLLETVPMDREAAFEHVDAAYKAANVGGYVIDPEAHALRIVETGTRELEREADRRASEAKGKRESAERLRRDNVVSSNEAEGLLAERDGYARERAKLVEEHERRKTEIDAEEKAKLGETEKNVRRVCDTREDAVRQKLEDYNARIRDLEVELAAVRERRNAEANGLSRIVTERDAQLEEFLDKINVAYDGKRADLRAETERRGAELKGKVDALNERLDAAMTRARNLETAGAIEAEAKAVAAREAAARVVCGELKVYHKELLADMPLKGLEVRQGEVYYDGHPFDKLSGAEQIGLSVQLSTLNLGAFRFVVLDGCERLDSASFEALRQHLKAKDVQALVTRVGDGELEVEVENGG